MSKLKIRKALLPKNEYSRPGTKLKSINGIVIHWTANPGGTADNHVSYFNHLALQNPDDDTPDRYAGAHYFVDISGEVVQLVPDDERAYHVGAKTYKPEALKKFKTTYPNNCLIGIELCHPDSTGKFTEETLKSTRQLILKLMSDYDLLLEDVVRHYDITGKNCPKYFVENEIEYKLFRDSILEDILHGEADEKLLKRYRERNITK